MTRTELERLARDRPLVTRELHPPSAFYGHIEALKRYAGMPPRSRPKVAIAHGVYLTDFVWDVDVGARVPTYLCASEHQARIYSAAAPTRTALAVGPTVLYAPRSDQEGRPDGRVLVAFPAHSTHHVDAVYDVARFADRLKAIKDDWDQIRVCMYWRDVLRGAHLPYLERGFECVTAGHIYDAGFLTRLRRILEGATAVVSNEVGSFVFQAVALGRPVWLVDDEVGHHAAPAILRRDAPDPNEWDEASTTIRAAFAEEQAQPTAEQLALAERYATPSAHRSPGEMASLLAQAESRYRDFAGPAERASHRLRVAGDYALARARSLRAQRA